MWIVRVALSRPYTFVVLALLILMISPLVILRTPTDVFPNIDIPVIAVVWTYSGLNAEDMEGRMTSVFERNLTTTVNNIEHIESFTVDGRSIIKVFLQPGASVDAATTQIAAISQTAVRQMPPGTTPPFLLTYNASTVPIIQLALSSKTLSEAQLNDLGLNSVRTQLVTIPGAAIPYPYGGKSRQVNVSLNSQLLQSKGLSAADVVSALGTQNLILPVGHGENRPVHLRRGSEFQSAHGRGDERFSAEGGQRDADLYARCRDGFRRIRAADQHCAAGRRARHTDFDPEKRRCLHAGCCEGRERYAAADPGDAAEGTEDRTAGGSVDLRARGGQRSGARGA